MFLPAAFLLLFPALEPQGNSPHLEAEKGQFLRLLCAADGQPPAKLSWALEDRVLSRSHPGGSGTLELVLPAVKPGDSGCYTCRAENRLGSRSCTLDLFVQCECDLPGPGFQKGRGMRRLGLGAGSQAFWG